ncbi:DUF6194 family protein [Streptomyces sp. NBC_01456]|uniref:DUF6194 family protein n=1 Tax=unclassified Streptomyces TaxID=2593676 RepID=UPI002E2ED72D|nr:MULTISPECIES: DUF6194 family protein [unclassified Streptomyces]
MTIDEIISFVEDLGGVLAVTPGPDDGSPEISWGDTFFFSAPDGVVPAATQPFATIVTKNYPGDGRSRLDRPDTFRVNVAAGKESFRHWTGHAPCEPAADEDPGVIDTVLAHPVYGCAGWLAVVNPGPRTATALRDLLRTAHHLALARHDRRHGAATNG